MRILHFLQATAGLLVLFFPLLLLGQPHVKESLILKLDSNESIVREMSCFDLNPEKDMLRIVTRHTSGYYVWKNGKKKGPYESLPENDDTACPPGRLLPCAAYSTKECHPQDYYTQYVSSDASMAMYITHNGVNHGPFSAVMQLEVTCDKAAFAAIVMDMESHIRLIHSGGKNLALSGNPFWLKLSPDGSTALAAMGKMIDPANMDVSKLTFEDFTSFRVFSLDGKAYGPYRQDKTPQENFWFSNTSGSNWYMLHEGAIYKNGNLLRPVPDGYSPCQLWFGPDGERLFVSQFEGGTLTEDNNTVLMHHPLQVITRHEKNRTKISWISLDKDNRLVLYESNM
ncbi:MAG TPA: hypothetical protein P5531_07635 [Bacteroidales bacterium]|nr:hypothetical protein [Bacteroidales bacterium]HSA43243.1 hypothetical protein [Bacteroidales bacterium]